jgi:hypothetical protein
MDPEGARDRDQAVEEALGRDLERDQGRAEEKRQGLLYSFPLEARQTADGCLSAVQGRLKMPNAILYAFSDLCGT